MQVKAGVVQLTPAFFDNAGTLAKIDEYLKKMTAAGCQLALFPESTLPGYPRGLDFGAVVGRRTTAGRELWRRYWETSVTVPGPITDQLGAMARRHNLFFAIGITERDECEGSLYCTLLYFSPEEGLIGKHRKLKPTGTERLIWGEGRGDDLHLYPTAHGRIGGLICWENYMPLARYALYEQGIDVYLAPTADARPVWTATMQHIALEGRCFVLGCNQYARTTDYPQDIQALLHDDEPENFCRGGSVIVDPLGQILAGPLWGEEGILIAKIDLDDVIRGRMDFAAAGHYQRPDVFGHQ